jgi:hypothetical protein
LLARLPAPVVNAPLLPLDPGALLVGKILGLAFGSPPRDSDPHGAVPLDADDIAPRARMPDKPQREILHFWKSKVKT